MSGSKGTVREWAGITEKERETGAPHLPVGADGAITGHANPTTFANNGKVWVFRCAGLLWFWGFSL